MIVFDFDGTITDMTPRWYALHIHMAKKYGLPVHNFEEYVDMKRDGMKELDIMLKLSDDKEAISKYDKDRIEHIEDPEYLAKDVLVPGALEALEEWGKRGPLIVLTKRRSDANFQEQARALGLNRYFAIMYATEGIDKKDFLKDKYTAEELKVSTFISDGIEDYKTAKELSMRPILVGWGTRKKEYFEDEGIDDVVETLEELTKLGKILDNRS